MWRGTGDIRKKWLSLVVAVFVAAVVLLRTSRRR
jgi:hypothetical protein